MPIYAYQCQACSHYLEALRKMSDAPLIDCPACGQPSLKKQLTAPSFRLGGGGWYETDFKTGNKKNLAGEQSTPAAGAAVGGADKSSTGTSSADKAPAP